MTVSEEREVFYADFLKMLALSVIAVQLLSWGHNSDRERVIEQTVSYQQSNTREVERDLALVAMPPEEAKEAEIRRVSALALTSTSPSTRSVMENQVQALQTTPADKIVSRVRTRIQVNQNTLSYPNKRIPVIAGLLSGVYSLVLLDPLWKNGWYKLFWWCFFFLSGPSFLVGYRLMGKSYENHIFIGGSAIFAVKFFQVGFAPLLGSIFLPFAALRALQKWGRLNKLTQDSPKVD